MGMDGLKFAQSALLHMACQLAVGSGVSSSRNLAHVFAASSAIGMSLRSAPIFLGDFAKTIARDSCEEVLRQVDSALYRGMIHATCSPREIRAFAKLPAKFQLYCGIVVCQNTEFSGEDVHDMTIEMETEFPTYDLMFEFSANHWFRVKAKCPIAQVSLQRRVKELLQGFKKASIKYDVRQGTVKEAIARMTPWGSMVADVSDMEPLALPKDETSNATAQSEHAKILHDEIRDIGVWSDDECLWSEQIGRSPQGLVALAEALEWSSVGWPG